MRAATSLSYTRPRRLCFPRRFPMNRFARLVAFALVLLLLFLGAMAMTQSWLRSQTEEVRRETIALKEAQFDKALALIRNSPEGWNDDTPRVLGQLLGAQILSGETADKKTSRIARIGHWEFTRTLSAGADGEAQTITVRFPPTAVEHLAALHRQCAVMLLILALGLALAWIGAVILSLRNRSMPATDSELRAMDAEMKSLTELAKVSVQQNSALERERLERQRAEEDAHFQQMLLNRALEEKIRLGHDLHDGIIQSLYAAGLTVEAARNLIPTNADEAARQLDAGLQTINTTIREVRSYISGLAPENLQRQNFAEAIRSLTQTLDAGRGVEFDLRIDDEAARALTADQITHLIQISREAVSNALRHGHASHITIRLHRSANELALLVQDNGGGFSPPSATGGGHGLANMRARAERLGGKLQFSSSPGAGTKLILTLATDNSSAA